MTAFVNTIQRKLECSYKEAFLRVMWMFVFLIAMIGVVAVVYHFFPSSSYEHRTSVLPGDHVQVSAIPDSDVLVEDKGKFLGLAEGHQTFIAADDFEVAYMVKVEGVSYRYDEPSGVDLRYDSAGYEVRNGELVWELHRSTTILVVLFVALPGFALIVLGFLMWLTTIKSFGLGNSSYTKSLFGR